MSKDETLPGEAQVVIIGGGIIGCSTAYHLAELGVRDVILLEKGKLTSGSTFHAAGLVGQLRANANVTQLLKYSVELYQTLEKKTGQATGWKMSGCLRLANNKERMVDYRRQATMARSFGLEMEILNSKECASLWPIMESEDLLGGCFMPSDGQVNPSDITEALAKGARKSGVKIFEDCCVTEILKKNGRIVGISSTKGEVSCEKIVNCGGQWAREIGNLAGVSVPLISIEHQYMITEKIPNLAADMPTIRDPDRLIYFKEEVGGLVAGVYEANPKAWAVDGIPEGFNFTLLESDWEHFEPAMEQFLQRVPLLRNTGIKELVNGPESFTPDGNFILGEAPEVKNFFVGAGFNAFGIASGGGAGRALAEWVAAGEAPMDLWPVDIRRFGPHHRDLGWVRSRALELYAKHYTVPWPFEEHDSSRPLIKSQLYSALENQGACFGEKMGWERPNWFAPKGVKPIDKYSFGRPNWFRYVGNEHHAIRERAGIIDQSSFAKFEVKGIESERVLSWICSNNVKKPPGNVTYTQMLNLSGGIECDAVVARLEDDFYYIVTGTGFRTHNYSWIFRNIPKGCKVELIDRTDEMFALTLAGPGSRQILQAVTPISVKNKHFPFATCQAIEIAGAEVIALRISYLGELGWELHGRRQDALVVYKALMAAGQEIRLKNCGYRVIETLRLEKGFRSWGADIGPDFSPDEAGLGWAVKMKTNQSFLGREAVDALRSRRLQRKLAFFTIDDPSVVLLGRETIYRNGERVGWLSSAGWGYTVKKNIGMGYVREKAGIDERYIRSGHYELEIATKRMPCEVHLSPLYDPEKKKMVS